MHRTLRRLLGCGVFLVLAASCHGTTAPTEAPLTGTVYYKFATPGASYPGEIGITGTSIGRIRVYITDDLPMRIRSRSGSGQPADFDSIVVGDSVVAWYATHGVILDSDPPVYPVVRLEFRR